MYAQAYTGGSRRVLVVLQGMDTSGKGGVVDHALGQLRPSGLRVSSFKKPTEEELSHDFLWRVEKALPEPGFVGVFDRSHYEDVLVARVHELADEAEIERRYGAINDFEKELVESGTVVIKCFLHVSLEEQGKRLRARLDEPDKQWKFHPSDIDERERWEDYRQRLHGRSASGATPTWRRGTSSRATRSGTATGPSASSSPRHCAGCSSSGPEPDYDVEEQRARLT